MNKLTTFLLAAATAVTVLAVSSGAAGAASSTSASVTAAKLRVVPIAMRDPGCHWFAVGGAYKSKLVVNGKTAFRNLDEAAVVFKGKSSVQRLAVGKTLTIAAPGLYHVTMVGQHKGDNILTLIVKT